MKGGSISAMADPCLSGAYIVTEFQNVLSIAVQRTTPNEQERPNIEEVLQKLEETHILSLNFKSNCKNFLFFIFYFFGSWNQQCYKICFMDL